MESSLYKGLMNRRTTAQQSEESSSDYEYSSEEEAKTVKKQSESPVGDERSAKDASEGTTTKLGATRGTSGGKAAASGKGPTSKVAGSASGRGRRHPRPPRGPKQQASPQTPSDQGDKHEVQPAATDEQQEENLPDDPTLVPSVDGKSPPSKDIRKGDDSDLEWKHDKFEELERGDGGTRGQGGRKGRGRGGKRGAGAGNSGRAGRGQRKGPREQGNEGDQSVSRNTNNEQIETHAQPTHQPQSARGGAGGRGRKGPKEYRMKEPKTDEPKEDVPTGTPQLDGWGDVIQPEHSSRGGKRYTTRTQQPPSQSQIQPQYQHSQPQHQHSEGDRSGRRGTKDRPQHQRQQPKQYRQQHDFQSNHRQYGGHYDEHGSKPKRYSSQHPDLVDAQMQDSDYYNYPLQQNFGPKQYPLKHNSPSPLRFNENYNPSTPSSIHQGPSSIHQGPLPPFPGTPPLGFSSPPPEMGPMFYPPLAPLADGSFMNPHTGEIFYSAEPPFFSGSPVPDAYYAYPTPHEYGRGEPAHLSPQAQEFVPSSIDFIPHGPQASQVWRQKPQGHRHDNRRRSSSDGGN